MKCYPIPEKYRYQKNQLSGKFLEHRNDRIHCGIDLYAPRKTPVFAVDDGVIRLVSHFTTPLENSYWNITFQIILDDESTYYYRYAELDNVLVKQNEKVVAGQRIGSVGQVLNPHKVEKHHPTYIQQLIRENKVSMLHFEVYDCFPEPSDYYLGGNWFDIDKPKGLCDPTPLLNSI